MISPAKGVAFSEASDGDMRFPGMAREQYAATLSAPPAWATVQQAHGPRIIEAEHPGDLGQADGIFTTRRNLALAVFTADCAGVVVVALGAIGVAHAGWRGAAGGVVSGLITAMGTAGHEPIAVYLGPTIGPCCFEVGPEVTEAFPGAAATTSWGTPSVDLTQALIDEIRQVAGDGLTLWFAGECTRHDPRWFSHRRDATPARMVALAWIDGL